MTFTISPFVCGIIVTILTEFIAIIIYGIFAKRK